MSSMLDALSGPGGPVPGAPPPEEAPSEDPTEILNSVIEGIKAYIDSEASDAIETEQAVKGLAIFQGLLASEQKNQEAASGTTAAHKGMAKQINSIAGQVYGG